MLYTPMHTKGEWWANEQASYEDAASIGSMLKSPEMESDTKVNFNHQIYFITLLFKISKYQG